MSLSAREILENKGFTVKDENAEALDSRWKAMEAAKESIDIDDLAETKIGLTNIPGGEQID